MKYFILALTLISCTNRTLNERGLSVSTAPLDTIQTVTPSIIATPALFESAFSKGSTFTGKKSVARFYGVNIGTIKISSGHIIACDPMHIDEYGKPFTQVFPTGEFPVQLSIVNFGTKEEIAFARIKFSDAPVERWELALLKGQGPLPVGSEDIHGYGVDAGVGVFIDSAANELLDFDAVSHNSDGLLYQEMDKNYRNDWRYAIYSFKGHNLAAFTSGEGDGYYATYIGFDTRGNPCRLLTDFGLVNWKQVKQ
jgi:hypothetical protein